MAKRPPKRPEKGNPVPHNWFQEFYDYVRSLEVRGDLETTLVSRDNTGTVVRAPRKVQSSLTPTSNRVMVAKITADNGDGTYQGELQKNAGGTFSNAANGTITFDSGNSGNLYELNGRVGVDVGNFVFVNRVADSSGDLIWYFDASEELYGLDGSTGNGAWVEITGGTGPYSWKQKDADATTDTSPAVTGSSNLYEVEGRPGIKVGSTMWAWFDGTNYQSAYHGAPSGTKKEILTVSDSWDRDAQGSFFGAKLNVVLGKPGFEVQSDGKIYAHTADVEINANGEVELIDNVTKKFVAELDPTAITVTTPTDPDDPSIVSGMILWLEADAITGLSDGDSVTTWSDSSAAGNDVTQSTSSKKPVYKTNQYGPSTTLPCVRFDGTDDVLSRAGILSGTAFTIYAVCKEDATGDHSVFSDFDNDATPVTGGESGVLFPYYVSGEVRGRTSDGTIGGNDNNCLGGSGQTTTLNVWAYQHTGVADKELYRAGSSIDTSTTNITPDFGASMVAAVGARVKTTSPGTSGHLDGDVCEIIVYDEAHSDAVVTQVSEYLKQKWGL